MSKIYDVLTANPKGHTKNLTVKGGDGTSVAMRLHRFAVVGKGDRIRFGAAGSNKVFVVAKDEAELVIPLTPLFSTTDTVSIGKDKFRISIREINSETAMRGLEFLEQFHYKTNNSLAERHPTAESKNSTMAVGGRRAVLYADIQIGERWLPAAYIDFANAADDVQAAAQFIRQSLSTPETLYSLGALGSACDEGLSECDCSNRSDCRES